MKIVHISHEKRQIFFFVILKKILCLPIMFKYDKFSKNEGYAEPGPTTCYKNENI
jgi:hypothetical protein